MNIVKDATSIMLNIDDCEAIIDEILENEDPITFIEIIRNLCEFGRTRRDPEMPKEQRLYYRMLKKTAGSGIRSMDENAVGARYGGYVTKTKRANTKSGKREDDGLLTMAEWWAKNPDYTPELFTTQSWYNEAREIREALASAGKPQQAGASNISKENTTQQEEKTTSIEYNSNSMGNMEEKVSSKGGEGKDPTNSLDEDQDRITILDFLRSINAIEQLRAQDLTSFQKAFKVFNLSTQSAEAFRCNADLTKDDDSLLADLTDYIYKARKAIL